MKTDTDLEQIFDALRDHRHILRCDDVGPGIKLLRSIQIDALRHAREIIDTGYDDGKESRHYNLERMDLLIRELELR